MTGSVTYRLIMKIKEDIRTSLIIGFIHSFLTAFARKFKASFLLGRFFNKKNDKQGAKQAKNNFVVKSIQCFFNKLHQLYKSITEDSFSIGLIKSFFTLQVNLVFAYFGVFIFSLFNFKVIHDLINNNTEFVILSITGILDALVLISFILPKKYSSWIISRINGIKEKGIVRNSLIVLFGGLFFLLSLFTSFYKIMALCAGLIVVYFILRFFEVGIYLLAISIPFLPDQLTIIVLLVTVTSGFIHWIIEEKFKININKYNTVFVLMLIVFTLNTMLSVNPSGSIRDLIINGLSVLLIIHMINSIENKNSLYILIDIVIISGLVTSLYAFYQYFAGVPMGSGWVDPSSNISIRVFSTFENPNLYAEYLIMIIPITFARLLSVKLKNKLFYMLIALVQLIALLLTFSRGGWLGLIFALGIFVLFLKRDSIIKIIPLGIVGLFFLPSSVMMRIKSIGSLADSSNFYRFQIWENSINIVKDFFITGVGLGFESFRSISSLYIKDFSPYHAHNTYLELIIEIGFLGLLLFIWLLGYLLKDVRYQKKSQDKVFTVALLSGIAGLFIHGVAEHVLYNPKIIFQFWLMVGLLITFNVNFMKVREKNEYINDY